MSIVTRAVPKSPPTSIEVVAWPLRDRPGVAWTTIGLLALIAVTVRWATGSWFLALLAMAATALTAWRIFVPQRFEFSAVGITQRIWRRKRRIAWNAIGQCQNRGDGLYLLPVGAEAPIDALHGLFIPLGEQRDEVIALVQQHLNRAARPDTSLNRSRMASADKSALTNKPDQEQPA